MNILRKLLRGIYYFCAGIKHACAELAEWYTTNKNIPRLLRNRATLLVVVAAIVAGGWSLISAITNMDGERRTLPVSQNSSQEQSESGKVPSSSESEPQSASSAEQETPFSSAAESSSSDAVIKQTAVTSKPEVDAIASATRFTPITAEQLTKTLAERVKKYYETAKATGVVFTPPAAGDITAWKAINPDVMGWISISNTNISYPVLKGPYTDYYTHRGYYKESSRNGVIWVDTDTKLAANGAITSQNTVVYGHNWTNCWKPIRIGNPNDIMFAQLAAYDSAEFTASNPYIRLATADGDHLYQVFAVFYTDLNFAYTYADLPGNGILNIVNTAKAKSIHKLGVSVGANDKIITLSTCTRVLGAGDNQRFVVMGKKIS
ncbi:class B sortase [Oscillospiraceae bacterium PP1C4]